MNVFTQPHTTVSHAMRYMLLCVYLDILNSYDGNDDNDGEWSVTSGQHQRYVTIAMAYTVTKVPSDLRSWYMGLSMMSPHSWWIPQYDHLGMVGVYHHFWTTRGLLLSYTTDHDETSSKVLKNDQKDNRH